MMEPALPLPGIPTLAFASFAILVAGFIRGYSGFGFSMITVLSLSLVFQPVEVVPVILILEIAASAWLLPQVFRKVDWPALGWLFIGVLIGTPIGVLALANIPAKPMRATIALLVIIMVLLLWRGFRLRKKPGRSATVATGVVSGTLNGAAAIGGPPVILFFFSSQSGVDISRATIIAFFLGTDVLASIFCLLQRLMNIRSVIMAGALLIPLIAGIQLGNRSFIRTDPETFRKTVMLLLMGLSVMSLLRSIYG